MDEATADVSAQTLQLLREVRTNQDQFGRRLEFFAGELEELRNGHDEEGEPDPEDSEQRLTAVETAVKWATPWRNLLVLLSFFIVGGVAVIAALRSYAEEAVIETAKRAHGGDDPLVEPSVKTVSSIQEDVGSMKGGVDCLVAAQSRAKEVKKVEVELELHRQQHAELLQEWSAKKAARRNAGTKPKKSDRHVQLEATLATLTAAPPKQCKEESPQ